jgi:hypothetical protein
LNARSYVWDCTIPACARAGAQLELIKEFAMDSLWPMIDEYLATGGLPPYSAEFGRERAERATVHARATLKSWGPRFETLDDRTRAAFREFAATNAEDDKEFARPKWGTPEAREREMRRLERRVALQRRKTPDDEGQR